MAVIPVYNMLIVPNAKMFFKTSTYQKVSGREPVLHEKTVLLISRGSDAGEEEHTEGRTREDFYPIGVTGDVTEINNNGYVVIRTDHRVNIEDVVARGDGSLDVSISRRPEVDDLDEEEAQMRLKKLKGAMIQFAEEQDWGAYMRSYITQWTTIEAVASAMSPWIVESNEERYAILAEDSRAKRFDMMEHMIYENLEINKINTEAKSATEEDYQKIYRENAIKKQMEYLQKELDEMHPEDISDLRRLELAIDEAGMNKEAEKEARKVLSRLKQEGQKGPESGMLYDYLDFVTGLSWKKTEPVEINMHDAERILEEDHFGLEKVRRRVLQQIAVMNLKHEQAGSILLFVGAPGTGKTSICRSIAKALGREYVRVSLGGVRDEADIRGHRRTYIGAMPGRIMDGIAKSGVSNPVMVLDEVDKLSASYNGDPASALLEVLDPEQNATFTDHYMNVPYDLSDVLFICTANTLETIPEPLLNRMEVIPFNGYTPIEKFQIARRHLMPKALSKVGITSDDIEVTDEAIRAIISDYTREAGVRGLKKRLETLCRTAAVKIVERKDAAEDTAGDTGKLVVRAEDLREFLDMHPLHEQHVEKEADPGVVTGLAWTSVGGTILYIETLMNSGSGKMTITGQLGDVMKESAQIAVSLVKSLFPEKAEKFAKNDLHIHVPDGATPKDGPSAGVTLTTALASLVTGNPVDPRIAMTGEVSLQGKVKPIGGLPEKLMAAQRAGVKKVFIPKENVEDLDDVAKEVRDQLQIIPVTHVTEILQQTGVMELSRIPSAV